ncbi:AAA ATPase, AAA+ lid domain [Dillenia turbinata]|uniref:AAA ATPase, AAA+ lid domain n=1 Tax=Dillenia turbinata TaxID=194707 RepID=A0AAN8V9A9_9MAGN
MARLDNYTPICKLFKRMNSWCFDEKLLLQSLYKTLVSTSETSSIILYIRDAENILLQSQKLCTLFDKMLKKISGSILILGSRVVDPDSDFREVDEKVALLFPYGIEIRAPEGETHLGSWKAQFEEDMKMIKFQDNKNHIHEVLAANDIDCDDLGSICQSDTMVLSNYIEEIVVSAVSYHLMNNKDPEFRNGKLVISMKSLSHGFSIFQDGKNGRRDTLKMETNAESSKKVPPDNEFEKRIRPEVIPANEIGVTFSDIDEKNVRALFTLAAKVAPTIIFVDEVDSMLGQRTRVGEHEAMRKIKNEFMTRWDGLLTKPGEQILVLAATNRPFDLDEAIIRRFERRIMVGLPSVESRELILKTLLGKERTENLEFKELATMTEGYSGSDLKNLCITAAYRPVRELMQQERQKDEQRKKKAAEGQGSEGTSDTKEEMEEKTITIRPLNLEDMKQAKNQVAASFAAEGSIMSELKQWNDLYGEGGSRKRQQLTYFL